MESLVVKRSVVIVGHKTSVSLEDPFWKGLKEIASIRDLTLSALIADIDSERKSGNLSSAIRLFVLDQYRRMTGAPADSQSAHTAQMTPVPSVEHNDNSGKRVGS